MTGAAPAARDRGPDARNPGRMTATTTTLELSAAFMPNDRTAPVLSGRVQPEGITLLTTPLHASEMFWRQLKFGEFDVSEMSVSSLVIATSNGNTDWVALPIFSMRHFFHTSVLVRKAAGISTPADLRGKRIGVPEYQQTWAVWSRGILADEFGVQPKDMIWYMERAPEQSHGGATGFTAPPGVELHYIPKTTNMGEMMVNGELDATLLYLTSNNLIDRSRIDLEKRDDIQTLFADPLAEAKRYYAKTKMFPINHTVVMKRSVYEQHPGAARSIYDAFVRAKALQRKERDARLEPWLATGLLDAGAATTLAHDPMPYGVVAARRELETIARYDYEQGLAKRLVTLDELFAPELLEL
jgi:4,5-dihydroxyphthalate decarboxylase